MHSRVGVLIATVALAGLVTVGLGMPAPGLGGGPAPMLLQVVPTDVVPGGTFTVSGTECHRASPASVDALGSYFVSLSVNFTPTPFGPIEVEVNPDATWSQVITVPADTLSGTYTVSATCETGAGPLEYPSGTVTVTAVAAQEVVAQPRTTG